MVNVDKLCGRFAEYGLTREEVANSLGITRKTLYSKLKSGTFTSAEMSKLVGLLHIEDPSAYFFAELGTQRVPNDGEE